MREPGELPSASPREAAGLMETNAITLRGVIVTEFVFSHEVFGESFYNFFIEVKRLSDNYDILPVTISDRLMNRADFGLGKTLAVSGQIRSYNSYFESEKKNRLVLTVFARDYEAAKGDDAENPNDARLCGYICKPPIYRTTPFGREITDMLVAVNRSYNKSDYIPCIAWGRNARFAGKLEVGAPICVYGRMQSREYQKRLDGGEILNKTAYEVSIAKLE